MLLLNAQDIRDCTDIKELLAVLARDYRASARTPDKVPPRHVIEHPAHKAFSLFMPAVLTDRKVMGVKVSSFFPGNVNRGLPAINGAVLLLDSCTGQLQAMLDSCALTALRTAAMSALATDRLCPIAQPTLAIIGAGVQAKAHIEAMAAIRTLRRVKVVARDLDRCHAFAVSMSEQIGVPVEAVKSVKQALLDADIVCTTTSHDKPSPLVHPHQLKRGVHINAIGGSTLQACEVDPCLLSQALIHVDDPQAAMHESGEISQALARSLITSEQVVGLEVALREPALPWQAGAQVVVPSPVFSFYYQMLDVNGVEAVIVPYERRGKLFHLPCDVVLEALSGRDGLILCNPNNPLGVQIEPDDLQRLIARCVELNKPVIVDECYYEYLRHSCLGIFSGLEQLFVIRSFSKYFGLAGLRVGYVVASTHAVSQLLKLRGPWDINHAAVKAALHCLANQPELAAAHDRQDIVRTRIVECCQGFGIGVIDTLANFLLLDDGPDQRLAKALHEAGIRFSDCSQYPHAGSLLTNVLRVAIPKGDDLQSFIQALKEA